MLKGLEKARALREFRGLREALTAGSLKAVEKARSLKRFRELRVLLGGDGAVAPEQGNAANESINPLYQSVLDGAPITRELMEQVEAEGQKDPEHPQLRLVVRIVLEQCRLMVAA